MPLRWQNSATVIALWVKGIEQLTPPSAQLRVSCAAHMVSSAKVEQTREPTPLVNPGC